LEVHYRKDKMGAPVRGYRVSSQKLLVKVVKRKRKDGKGGVFTTEVIGPINQTVRFRCRSPYSGCFLLLHHLQG
jgi:general transcription factor 3C polypeptide 5 (transcription factor C subunit 1)